MKTPSVIKGGNGVTLAFTKNFSALQTEPRLSLTSSIASWWVKSSSQHYKSSVKMWQLTRWVLCSCFEPVRHLWCVLQYCDVTPQPGQYSVPWPKVTGWIMRMVVGEMLIVWCMISMMEAVFIREFQFFPSKRWVETVWIDYNTTSAAFASQHVKWRDIYHLMDHLWYAMPLTFLVCRSSLCWRGKDRLTAIATIRVQCK